ncbi:CrcB family protein [Micromonospora sp. PPF5-17]|uniref:Fluoride-specific ion channel n=1 Tax=Micromonospora solifontis TaxID=2487138 RepID=A0ABX9WFW3_9ACTN|nr:MULTISPECIES: CrcB family protein [Micromonospora]NES38285.1 CrcB family protein [Micromonospora solifontis]NES58678.1 CrcB family protein [Micromonospora sp. PPF5-6]RNL96353.1 CrcB family protein [Micromonospora solifontis]
MGPAAPADLCGALSTYSTFGYETIRLFEDGARFYSLLNAGISVAAGIGAAFVGVSVAQAVWL